jgi:hypothetical protein
LKPVAATGAENKRKSCNLQKQSVQALPLAQPRKTVQKRDDIFFPKLSEELHLIKFSDIAIKFLHEWGDKPIECENEEEARAAFSVCDKSQWPCLFAPSDTTGEKDFEEFFRADEFVDWQRFKNLGVVKNQSNVSAEALSLFLKKWSNIQAEKIWEKKDVVDLFESILPEFEHEEKGKYLDSKM